MVFNELRTLAFRIAPEIKTLEHQFVTLSTGRRKFVPGLCPSQGFAP